MNQPSDQPEATHTNRLFAGGGEAGKALANIDWSTTALGPVETWPQALRTSLRICLTSRHDIIVWWGSELIFFYNDAYSRTLGARHPSAAGKPGWEVWPEIWDTIGPMLDGVRQTGQPTWSTDQMLILERNGYAEETYHTYSYSPIEDDGGVVSGIFTAVTETTERVLGERRMDAARDLIAAMVDARGVADVCSNAARALASDPSDVPFALIYLIDDKNLQANLAASVGMGDDLPLAPTQVEYGNTTKVSPRLASSVSITDRYAQALATVARTGQSETLSDLPSWPDKSTSHALALPHRAVVLPVTELGHSSPSALMIVGVNSYRALDDSYEQFYVLLTNHLASALASAHAYEQERQRAESLATLDRAKTVFFSNISHEFRTPLTLLLSPLEDLLSRETELSAEQRHELEMAHRNSLRLLKLVNTLLDFARIEAGRIQASFVPTDLAAFTSDLASSFRSLIEHAGLRLIVECQPLGEPSFVDRDMWEKIVLNLLSNAFKFTLSGDITVRLARVGEQVELSVSDTGSGIPADELPQVFERFHRVEGIRARTQEGSGIGLALVHELVRLHGGSIRVQSEVGIGSTFTVTLPIGAEHLPAERIRTSPELAASALGAIPYLMEAEHWDAEASPALVTLEAALLAGGREPEPANERPMRVVLADDNADMRDYLRRLLSERYEVIVVGSGVEALAAIHRNPLALPDLVLSDVMMPDMDGYALLRALRSDPTTINLPVILLSARAGEEATIEGLRAGADDYLVKPFSAREVLSRVAARLEISRTRQELERRLHTTLSALLAIAETIVEAPETATLTSSGRRAVNSAHHAREVATRKVLTLVQHVFVSEFTGVVIADLVDDRAEPVAVVGVTPQIEAQWRRNLTEQPLSAYIPEPYLGRLITDGLLEVDLTTQPPVPGQDYFGIKNVLLAAQQLPNGQYIIIGVETRSRSIFTAQENELARAAVRLVALMIDRDRLTHEREEAQARALALTETTRRMDEFMGIASHELRTPLTSVTANVQMAGRQLSDIEQRGARGETIAELHPRLQRAELLLRRTHAQMGRLDRLIGDLLDVSRIQAGKLELRTELCDLTDIIREAVLEQRVTWPSRTISLSMPSRSIPLTFADGDRIGQVLTNYLTNALKYSAADQPVAVEVRVDGANLQVSVRDHGPGLTASQQQQIFERFYRVPGIEQQSGSGIGLGLGLYICRTIIERHHGGIGVESTPGEGSVFWFTLPIVPEGVGASDGSRAQKPAAHI